MLKRHLFSSAAITLATLAGAAGAATSFVPGDQPIGYLGQPRSTSLDVRDGNQFVFYIDYERQNWTGNVTPYTISPIGMITLAEDHWPGGVAPILNLASWDTGRKVVTLKDDGTPIAFLDKNLSATQKAYVGSKASATYVRYLRGGRNDESPNGLDLRPRTYVLGDIIHSRPAYVGGTVPMLYVGANDGMLHAFRADTGEEVYAYIPSMLFPKLMNLAPLASAGYTHTYFVDGSPRTMQVSIGGTTKRILVGGLGAGGRGLFALDITGDAAAVPASESAAASKIMWEITNTSRIVTNPQSVTTFTSGQYTNLGHTYGEPIVGKSNHVVSGSDRDVIFMPNGYMSTTGCASLFVINPASGALIREIVAGSCSTTSPNGLSSPTPFDTNGDGRIDLLYAGDLDGNMWKFDVSSTNKDSWSVSLLYTTSPAQSITTGPSVAAHPNGGRIVAFGTGRVLMAADLSDNAVHYMYGVWDGAPVGATTFLTQTLSAEKTYTTPNGSIVRRVRTLTMNAPDWATHRGWKVAMPAGQRFAGDRLTLTNGRVYANTFNPTVNLDGATATPPTAVYENWKYQFHFLSGGGFTTPVFDLSSDGQFNSTDLLADDVNNPLPIYDRVPMGMFQNAGVASQPVVVTTTVGSQDLYTQNANLPPGVQGGDPGVSGGHFDVDVYYPTAFKSPSYSGYESQKHRHEYDDKFGVTGVNMLNASEPEFNLSNASVSVKRTSPQTQFKVLISHQFLNPAVQLNIGPSGNWVSVKDYGGQASTTDAQTVLNDAPTYTYDTIGYLVFGLPLDAFASKDWWNGSSGVGQARAGLIPTQTGCVKDISDSAFVDTPGPNGERHNGALVIQLISASTPASALELVKAGDATYGWRVKASEYRKYMLTHWTYFWHHPNGKCYGQAGWVPDPPQDPGSGDVPTPPPGTDDPRDGAFNQLGSGNGGGGSVKCSGTVVSTSSSFNAQTLTKTEVRNFSDNCTETKTSVNDGSGNITVTVTTTKSGQSETYTYTVQEVYNWTPNHTRTGVTIGRISWRELIRE